MAYKSQNIDFVQDETPPCLTVSFVSFDRQTRWLRDTKNDPLKNLVWDSTFLLSDPVVLPLDSRLRRSLVVSALRAASVRFWVSAFTVDPESVPCTLLVPTVVITPLKTEVPSTCSVEPERSPLTFVLPLIVAVDFSVAAPLTMSDPEDRSWESA